MSAYLSNRDLIGYITSDGITQSKIVSMAKIGDNLYYHLENWDYVEDTPFGLIKLYPTAEMLKAFSELHRGITWQQ